MGLGAPGEDVGAGGRVRARRVHAGGAVGVAEPEADLAVVGGYGGAEGVSGGVMGG